MSSPGSPGRCSGAVAVGSASAASAADPIVITCTGPVSFSGPIGQA
ncbi:MAG: hypothetical protein U0R65_02550 [Candidatus Nanopelagicales bacterium]